MEVRKCVWIISLIRTAVVIRCGSETCVAAVWMLWVLYVVGERIPSFAIAFTQSVALIRVFCPMLTDVGCQPN